jgi:hypothetical protein
VTDAADEQVEHRAAAVRRHHDQLDADPAAVSGAVVTRMSNESVAELREPLSSGNLRAMSWAMNLSADNP